jgi:long-chain fatty acid transport protein
MRRRGALISRALGIAALAVLAALAAAPLRPAFAAGFSISEQSAKATGMADAVAAQSDDPAVIYYNPGGMAFFDKAAGSVGATYITFTKADFHGANPFPGEGVTATEQKLHAFPPHAYWVQPITPELKLGIGFETPFGLQTRWQNPDSFSGRFLSTLASIKDIDVNPTVAWQVTPEFGIGAGFIARFSEVQLERDVPAVDPFTLTTVNAARIKLKSKYDRGYGFDVGFLNKPTPWFSWGGSYRSKMTVNYTGDAILFPRSSGDPIFDMFLAHALPYNTSIPVKTQIKFPDEALFGVAVKPMPDLTVEVDGNRWGWSTLQNVPITFPGGQLPNSNIVQRWKDSWAVRAGLNWTAAPAWQLRLGYVWDQTPQPEQVVNPLLPDANRNGVTAGIGFRGNPIDLDLGVMYLFFADRTRAKTFADDPQGPFFGTYSTRALLISLTVGFHQ